MPALLSTNWWSTFLNETSNLSKPKIFRNVIDDDLDELRSMIADTIRQISTAPPKQGLRVWIDGNQIQESEITKEIIAPSEGETLAEWAENNYSVKKMGIILNQCQNSNEKLKDYIATKLEPLIVQDGLPTGGLEITLFLGNYDKTPIGFHIDPAGHKVVHFHIGPGRKEMYLMTPQKYEVELAEITKGVPGFQEAEKLIPFSETYTINSGDLFYMPHGYYHIGKSYGFSIGITLWHRDLSVSELANKLTKLMIQKLFKEESNEIMSTDKTPFNDNSHLASYLAKITEADPEVESLNMKELLNRVMFEYKLALYSNSFIDTESMFTKEEIELKADDVICGRKPYKIFYYGDSNRIIFFVQAKRLEFPNNSNMPIVIERLNSFKEIKIQELVDLLKYEWEEDTCMYFLSMLFKHNAFSMQRALVEV